LERGRKRDRSLSRSRRDNLDEDIEMEAADLSDKDLKKAKRERSESRRRELSKARSHSKPRTPSQMGLKDTKSVDIAKKLDFNSRQAWVGGAGEGDHRKSVHLVKWQNTGKKRNGTHNKR